MKIWKLTPSKDWAARGMSVAVLTASLLVAQPVLAESPSTITAYAPGAPATAWIAVQWQNTDSTWYTVDGWQGDLDYTTYGVAYKQWAVDSADYGKGPFRWVVYTTEGGAVWAVSNSFDLPDSVGQNVEESIVSTAAVTAVTPAAAATAATAATASTTAASTELSAWSENVNFDAGGTNAARITMQIANVSPTIFVGVQYQDAAGVWQNVEGWQTGVTINDYGVAVVQWGVAAANFGQGPMRWVVYSANGGAIIGVSPSFDLPTQSGVDFILHLAR